MRQLRDMKGNMSVPLMDPMQLDYYGKLCGWALARAHARTSRATLIAGYLGQRRGLRLRGRRLRSCLRPSERAGLPTVARGGVGGTGPGNRRSLIVVEVATAVPERFLGAALRTVRSSAPTSSMVPVGTPL